MDSHCPKLGNGGLPIPLEQVLRIRLLQHFFDYSDPAMKEALYKVLFYCRFVGLDLAVNLVPDESAIGHFRHLLDRHDLVSTILREMEARAWCASEAA